MNLDNQIEMCTENYQRWKSLALSTNNVSESRKYLEKAFFWLELQSAFITLHAIEQIQGKNPDVKRKLLVAKTNLSKKLANYADEVLKEIK